MIDVEADFEVRYRKIEIPKYNSGFFQKSFQDILVGLFWCIIFSIQAVKMKCHELP